MKNRYFRVNDLFINSLCEFFKITKCNLKEQKIFHPHGKAVLRTGVASHPKWQAATESFKIGSSEIEFRVELLEGLFYFLFAHGLEYIVLGIDLVYELFRKFFQEP